MKEDGSIDWKEFATRTQGHVLGDMSAFQMAQNIQQTQAATDKIYQDVKESQARTGLAQAQSTLQDLNANYLRGAMQWMIQQAKAEANIDMAKVPAQEAEAKIMGSRWGVWIKAAQTILGIGGAASGIASEAYGRGGYAR